MVRVGRGLHEEGGDVGEVSASRLLVDRTLVEFRVFGSDVVDGINVHHWQVDKEDLIGRFLQLGILPVPTCTFQEETMDIHTFFWRCLDLIFGHPGDVIVKDNTVKGPSFVCTCYFLETSMQEVIIYLNNMPLIPACTHARTYTHTHVHWHKCWQTCLIAVRNP